MWLIEYVLADLLLDILASLEHYVLKCTAYESQICQQSTEAIAIMVTD